MSQILSTEFYQRNATEVAKELLGSVLQRTYNGTILSGRIVETEAYLQDDPACHAFKGKTPRTAAMFSPGGVSYVYLIYGMYYCFNTVTGKEGNGQAVLIRAIEPLTGLDVMSELRNTDKVKNFCSGPGKLCRAFNITKDENLKSLEKGPLQIIEGKRKEAIHTTTRIGISQGVELPYRYYLKNNSFISKV